MNFSPGTALLQIERENLESLPLSPTAVLFHGSSFNLSTSTALLERPGQPRFSSYAVRKNGLPRGHYFYNGTVYCSLSEAALGALLEKYVPGFKIRDGKTFQIPIDQVRTVDFLVKGVLVEYHPIKPLHEFRRKIDFVRWKKKLKALKGREREKFRESTKAEMAKKYESRRRFFIDSGGVFTGAELIVAKSPEEFFHKVIKRFGICFPPDERAFRAEFDELLGRVKRENRRKCRHSRGRRAA